ncbi:MAG: MerR family transcriptional regulator [Ruminococcaceae bacterium]|nr:MerR family transcriptional regulator [Oscillospiraceae bacterium]
MKTVREVSHFTGVTVRTLHHYDAIGLLKPTKVTEAGYRLYDEKALKRLQNILLFKELDFSLAEIKRFLDTPNFDHSKVLLQQIQLLKLKRARLDSIISHAEKLQEQGVNFMDFSTFNNLEFNKYKEEAKERWGNTEAYKEYEKKGSNGGSGGIDAFMDIFREFGEIKELSPLSSEAQVLVNKLQTFITDNYYTCTPEILQGLGQMYIADERFKENIDKAGGEGTALFVSKAILKED